MTTNKKIILIIVAIIVSFAAGRYSTTVNETIDKTKTTDKTADIDTSKNSHKVTNSVTLTKPDGTTEITTTTTIDSTTQKKELDNSKSVTNTETTKKNSSAVNFSVLAGVDIKEFKPFYGVILTKELIGPITIGVFGLTNGVVGVSAGLNF